MPELYDVPTRDEFKVRYPELVNAGATDTNIDAAIEDASAMVDKSWYDTDFRPAIFNLAAHYTLSRLDEIKMNASLSAGASGGVAPVNTFVSSVSFGDRTIGYSRVTGSAPGTSSRAGAAESDDPLAATTYGERFLVLRARNTAYVLVV